MRESVLNGLMMPKNKEKIKELFRWGPVWLLIAFGLFAVFMGSYPMYNMCLKPYFSLLKSDSWQPVKAVVISGEVNAHTHISKGASRRSYSIDFCYEYEWKDTKYRGNRYWFWGRKSSAAKFHRVVRNNPPGTQITCFVNPENPAESVISRESYIQTGAVILFSIFITSGLFILFFTVWAFCRGTLKNEWAAADET